MFYWIETGERWTIDTDLAAVEWEDNSIGNCVLPGEVTLKEGPDPHELIFLVKADPINAVGVGPGGNAVYPPIATGELADRQPDGTDGTISMPSFFGEAFKPFQIVRVRESADNTKTNPVTRFVGVILSAQLDLTQEEWRIAVYEIPRWYLTKVFHTGIFYQPPLDGTDPLMVENALSVYNEKGKADELIAADPDTAVPTIMFTAPDLNSYQGVPNPLWTANYAGYWTLGDVLNQLRYMYTVEPAFFGLPDLSKIMDWPEVTADKWKFLLIKDPSLLPQVIKNFALGGLNLNDCIDAIVRRAGKYTWGMKLDPTTMKYELQIYDLSVGDGRSGAITRNTSSRLASDSGETAGGMIGFDWSNCATTATVFGAKERWETTIGYMVADPDGGTWEEAVLLPEWTALEQDKYQVAEKIGDNVEKYDTVFRRFRISVRTDWEEITGHPSKWGPRGIMSELLTEDIPLGLEEQHRKIKVRVFRWDPDTSTYLEAPESVSVQVNHDLTVTIHGHDADDDPLQNAIGKRVYPRYLCKANPSDLEVPWSIQPFRVTVMVEDDARLMGTSTDKPAGWPDLEDVTECPEAFQENRIKALHGTRQNGPVFTPAQNDYTAYTYMNNGAAVTLHDDQATVDVTAQRRVKAMSRPEMKGELRLTYLDWDLSPGWQISSVQNYADPLAPPTVHIYGVIRRTTLVGLAAETTSQRHTVIELGTH